MDLRSGSRMHCSEIEFVSGPITILSPPCFAHLTKSNTWLRDTAFYILFVIPLFSSMRYGTHAVSVYSVCMGNGIIDATVINTVDCAVTNFFDRSRERRKKKSQTIPCWKKYITMLSASWNNRGKKEQNPLLYILNLYNRLTQLRHIDIYATIMDMAISFFPSLFVQSFSTVSLLFELYSATFKKYKNSLRLRKS